jgi:hypothetical protein
MSEEEEENAHIISVEDIIHLLLDEGYTRRQFKQIDNKVQVSKKIYKYLESLYNMDDLSSIVTLK